MVQSLMFVTFVPPDIDDVQSKVNRGIEDRVRLAFGRCCRIALGEWKLLVSPIPSPFLFLLISRFDALFIHGVELHPVLFVQKKKKKKK